MNRNRFHPWLLKKCFDDQFNNFFLNFWCDFRFFLEEEVGFFQKCGNPPLGGQQEALILLLKILGEATSFQRFYLTAKHIIKKMRSFLFFIGHTQLIGFKKFYSIFRAYNGASHNTQPLVNHIMTIFLVLN